MLSLHWFPRAEDEDCISIVNAPRAMVYRALIDARAVATWMAPTVTARYAYRASLKLPAPTAGGRQLTSVELRGGRVG